MKKTFIFRESITAQNLALFLVLYIIPVPVMAGDSHWAKEELDYVKSIDGIRIDDADSAASTALQERIFKIVGLGLTPQQGLIRYSLLKYMADELRLPNTETAAVPLELGNYIDSCDY